MTSRQSVFHTSSAPKTKKLHPLRSLPLVVTNPHAPYFSAFWRTMATQQQPIGTGQVLPPLPQPPPLTYRRTRGQSPKPHGFKPFCEKISSTWRVILTTIAVFLFTRWFQRYAILRVKPVCTEFYFSTLRHGDYVLWAELWFVVVCRCVK